MAGQTGSRLNVEAFQLLSGGNTLDVIAGIAVQEVRGKGLFVDPGNTGSSYAADPSGPENLVLGIDEELENEISPTGRIEQGSLYVRDSTKLDLALRKPFGIDKLGPPTSGAEASMGWFALVGVAESRDFTVTEVEPGWFSQTRELHRSPRNSMGRHIGDNVLMLLSHGGHIKVACGQGHDMNVYALRHDRSNRNLEIIRLTEFRQSEPGDDTGDGGPDSKDPEPSLPHLPADSAGAEAIPPRVQDAFLDLRSRKAS